MNIIEINEKSKMKDLYNKVSGVDKNYFRHRIDENLPPHSFSRNDQKPDLIKTKYGEGKTEFTLPKKGFLGKMFIKHVIEYENSAEAKEVDENTTSDILGAYIFKRMELTQHGNTIETLNSVGITERVNTSLFNNIKNIQRAMGPTRDANLLTFYTPLLFSLNSDINHFLDLKHVQEIKLSVENDSYLSLGLERAEVPGENPGDPPAVEAINVVKHTMILMIDYMSIKDYEEYSKESFTTPQMVAIENCVLESGKEFNLVGGVNTIRLRARDLVKKIILKNVSTLTQRKEIASYDLEITAGNETIYKAQNLLESLLFSKNYQGLVSHKVPDASDDGIFEIQFDIPNFRNSNSGCLNLDEIHKDLTLKIRSDNDSRLFINYLTYEMLIVRPDGLIEKTTNNNTAYLDDYRYEEPKESKPDVKDVEEAKDI